MGKLMATICRRFKLPEVIGEVSAGVIFGPYALGGQIHLFGESIVQVNEITRAFSLVGGMVVLFSAGLEFTFLDFFIRAGIRPFIVGTLGVVTPFILGVLAALLLNRPFTVGLIIGAVMAATSIAVTVRTLTDMKQIHSEEAKLIINAAVIDDVLSLAALAVVTSIASGETLSALDIIVKATYSLALWFALLIGAVLTIPRFINTMNSLTAKGTVEAAATISCFGLSFLSSLMGFSPVVGAFAAGMAVANSKAIDGIKDFIEKLGMVFSPLFFAIIGTYLNPLAMLDINFFFLMAILIVAILSKVLGCGLPSAFFLKDKKRGLRVGIGMLSRGEVGFIVAGVALASGLLTESTYAAMLTVILITTLVTPYLLKKAFD
jgi:Kef-type K+ transport system membrane component KefB